MNPGEPCKAVRGLLPLEFQRYLQHDGGMSGDKDVAHLQAQQVAGAGAGGGGAVQVKVSQAALLAAVGVHAGSRLLYLDDWLDFDLEGEMQVMYGACISNPSCKAFLAALDTSPH